jgi:hypothetical protein
MLRSLQHLWLSTRSPLATVMQRPEWCCRSRLTHYATAVSTKLWVEPVSCSTGREQPLMITDTYIVHPEHG